MTPYVHTHLWESLCKEIAVTLLILMFFTGDADAVELLVQDDPEVVIQQTDRLSQPQDANNPADTVPTEPQQKPPQSEYFGKKTEPPLSAHKLNYASIDSWPGNNNAQIKF